MASALADLAKAGEKTLATDINAELQELRRYHEIRYRASTMVIGLSAVNTVSLAPQGVPVSRQFPAHTRVSLTREEVTEIGGPGAIVARILAELDFPVVLVSRIARDTEGDFIWNSLAKWRGEERPIYIDLVEQVEPAAPKQRTWRSYVLVHPSDGQRVFLDREIADDFMTLCDEVVDSARQLSPRSIYFDRFLPGRIRDIISPPNVPLPSDTWVFYDSGEHGYRYKSASYYFEKELIKQKVNFALCSFRFAQHFLAHILGGASTKEVEDWMPEDIDHPQQKEYLEKLVGDRPKLKSFVELIKVGAKSWLRSSIPRVVVVTLHEFGAIWFDIDSGDYEHLTAPKSSRRICSTASAGDTFRGAFLAAIQHLRENGYAAAAPLSHTVQNACSFANLAASIKVGYPSVEQAIPQIRSAFTSWKSSVK